MRYQCTRVTECVFLNYPANQIPEGLRLFITLTLLPPFPSTAPRENIPSRTVPRFPPSPIAQTLLSVTCPEQCLLWFRDRLFSAYGCVGKIFFLLSFSFIFTVHLWELQLAFTLREKMFCVKTCLELLTLPLKHERLHSNDITDKSITVSLYRTVNADMSSCLHFQTVEHICTGQMSFFFSGRKPTLTSVTTCN